MNKQSELMTSTEPKKVLMFFLKVISVLLIVNLLGIISNFGLGHGHLFGLIPLTNFDTESNIPTLYSFLTLLIAAILLVIIGFREKKINHNWSSWIFLALVFLYLAIDEGSAYHEKWIEVIRTTLDTTGIFYFAWVIPYAILGIVLLLTYLRFIMALPARTRKLFILAGSIFVSGAIGFEMLSGIIAASYNTNTIFYALLTTGEELLEMIGIALFNYALLDYHVNQHGELRFTVTGSQTNLSA